MFGLVFLVTIVLVAWLWFKMRKVKTLLLEEQAQRREKKMQEELAAQDKEAAERRMVEVEQPQQMWRQPGQGQAWRDPQTGFWSVPPGGVPERRDWGAPPGTPGRAY